MKQGDFFELNAWGLSDPAARAYAQAAFDHDLAKIKIFSGIPSSWPTNTVDPAHLFACGATRSGGLSSSRRALSCLIEQGANLNAVDSSGWVPLSYAAWFGLAGSLDVLLEANAQVHPDKASPPLFHALSSLAQTDKPGSTTCARLLLMSGADPLRCSINEPHGRASFLSWALSVNNLEMASLLWAKGDRIRGEKELSILIWNADVEPLDWLIQHDYDVLGSLPADNPHRKVLFQAQSSRRRQALTELAKQSRPESSLISKEGFHEQGEDGDDGRRQL